MVVYSGTKTSARQIKAVLRLLAEVFKEIMQESMIDYETIVWVLSPVLTVGLIGLTLREKPYIKKYYFITLVFFLEVLWFIAHPQCICIDPVDRVTGALMFSIPLNVLCTAIAVVLFKVIQRKHT